MRLWDMVSDRQLFAERREADLLDEHARALVADRPDDARVLRESQAGELAALMALAEEIALVVAPVSLRQESLVRIRRLVALGVGDVHLERAVGVVRLPAPTTMLGAAIVGTAAVSLGRFALQYHRRRQTPVASSPN